MWWTFLSAVSPNENVVQLLGVLFYRYFLSCCVWLFLPCCFLWLWETLVVLCCCLLLLLMHCCLVFVAVVFASNWLRCADAYFCSASACRCGVPRYAGSMYAIYANPKEFQQLGWACSGEKLEQLHQQLHHRAGQRYRMCANAEDSDGRYRALRMSVYMLLWCASQCWQYVCYLCRHVFLFYSVQLFLYEETNSF